MAKKLVAYFSASGVTQKVAQKLSNVVNGDLFEIKPFKPYTDQDLDWMDANSRSSVEMKKEPNTRPTIENKLDNIDQYDTIYLGFPIWWYTAPKIINTFLESYDFNGKTVIPFATSGSSQMGKTNNDLKPSLSEGATLVEGKRFAQNVTEDELSEWVKKMNL